MNVQHSKLPLTVGAFQKDGDTDANLVGIHIQEGQADNPIQIEHGLERDPVGYQVIWSSGKAVSNPYVALREDGSQIVNKKFIHLVFDAEEVIINLRIW